MQYWLFKSEANTWSWDQQVAKGATGEEWDGVRNYQAHVVARLIVSHAIPLFTGRTFGDLLIPAPGVGL